MADFGQHMQSLRPYQPFSEMGMNMELLKQFAELRPSMLQNFNLPLPHPYFSVETPFAHQQAKFPAGCNLNSSFSNFQTDTLVSVPGVHTISGKGNVFHESKKREVTEQSTSDFQGDNYKNKRNRSGKAKKVGISEKEEGKPKEIIHVRAKRGQANDSHSRAERVRREKINKKMRCLQDLVPGCHKAMGMAGMLEEIINYVHSLQNQVEFLSTELAAACSQDLNFETESSRKAQGTNSHEAMVMEKWTKEAYGEYTCFHSTWSL